MTIEEVLEHYREHSFPHYKLSPHTGDAHLMVSVEFFAEENEVVGKVYDAESRLTYASEPRDAHLAGSVRATVFRLLRELLAQIAGDPHF
jgi:hypothetical protein